MPNIPNTNQNGLTLLSIGNGSNASYWGGTGTDGMYYSHTYSVSGSLAAWTTGASGYLPSFFIPAPSGQTTTLVGVIGMVHSGTSATISVYRGTGGAALPGSTIAGLTGLVLTSGASSTPTALTTPTGTVSVSDLDFFNIEITSVSGAPDGLSLTFVFSAVV